MNLALATACKLLLRVNFFILVDFMLIAVLFMNLLLHEYDVSWPMSPA